MINQNEKRIYPERPFKKLRIVPSGVERRGRRIAIFDLDGTLVSGHLWMGLIKHHFKKKMNRPSAIWYFLFHMLYLPLWKTHLISKEKYYRVWVEDLSNSMKGIKLDQAKEVFNWISDEYLLPTLKNNVLKKLKWHQKKGDTTILASNSFQDLIQIIAERLKINFAIGTNLEVTGDKFSGKIIPPLPFGREKAKRIKALLKEKNLNINFKESFAYSDSIFDLPMLELVGNSIVVGPDKKLLEIAKNRGWPIL